MSTPGMLFSENVTQMLSSLYSKGMVGWGVKYEPFLASAAESSYWDDNKANQGDKQNNVIA